jgi:tetratricopeptide (TPR) repeat protein
MKLPRIVWLVPFVFLSTAEAQPKPKISTPPKTNTKPTNKTTVKTPPRPAPQPSLFNDGVTAFKAGEYEKAEEIFRQTIKVTPKDPVLHYFLGRTLKRRSDCVGALAAFSAARDADIESTLPKETLAAEEIECQVLLTEIPATPQASAATEARVALEEGQAAFLSGDFEGALKALEQAQENRPNDAQIYYQRGIVLHSLGRYQEAMKALLSAQRLDPQLAFASPEEYRQALSRTQVRVGSRPDEKVRLFQDAFLNQTLQSMLQGISTENLFVSLPENQAQQEALTSLIKEELAKEKTVVLLSIPGDKDPEAVADALWQMELQYRSPAVLLIAAGERLTIRDSALSKEERSHIIEQAKGKLSSFEALQAGGLAAHKTHQEKEFYGAVQLWGGLGVGAFLLSALFFSWRRRIERSRAAYVSLKERLASKLLSVAESLALNRISLLTAPHATEPLLEAAEELYFQAQTQSQQLPSHKESNPPHWMAEEALFMIEEAERKSKRVAKALHESFGAPRPLSDSAKQFGCFFCARPIASEEGGYLAKVSFRGMAQQVLACRLCANQINAGDPPQVKMVIRKGRRRHWSQTRAFEPRYDFYAPRIPIELLSAVEAWGELFGDEGHTAMPAGGTLTSMPAIVTSKENATVQLQLSESENKT